MTLSVFFRIVAFPVTVGLFFLASHSLAHALEYSLEMEFDITLTDELSAGVIQTVTIVNESDEFLSSSLSLDLPFSEVTSLQVESNGEKLPATIENKRLWIDFSTYPLDYREKKVVSIKYQIPDFVEDLGSVHTFLWPKFNVEEDSAKALVKFNYPIGWEDVLYSSQGVDVNHAFDTRRGLVFSSVDKPLRLYTGSFSLKELDLKIDSAAKSLGRTALNVPLLDSHYLVGDRDAINMTSGNGYTRSQVNLEKYFENEDLGVIARQTDFLTGTVTESSYFSGVDKLQGISTEDPTKLYQIVLSRLQPSRNILEWSRVTVEETLTKQTQNDLDYANTLAAVFSSKGIPTHIVYGVVRYPDGEYYWHFWNLYQEREGQQTRWREIDPYLEDLTSQDFFKNVPPERIVWGILGPESSLIEVDTDLLYLRGDKFGFKSFDSPGTQTGYITSQINRKTVKPDKADSVLGLDSVRINPEGMGYNGAAVVSAVAGLVLISFARYFDHSERRYKVKLKPKVQ